MPHAPLIHDLAWILGSAAFVALLCHRLKQPVVLGYLLVGFLLGPGTFLPKLISSPIEDIQVWADLGVIFVMFHLGLEFSFRRFKRLGWSVISLGIWDVGIMFALGWLVAGLLGYTGVTKLFLGAMLAISSTTIIMKALEERGLRSRLFAERVTGLLIFEDLAAVFLIVALGAMATGRGVDGGRLLILPLELVIVVGGWLIVGSLVIPRIMKRASQSKSEELLVLMAIGLCLVLAVSAAKFQYSMALGAFIMGSIMNETREAERIEQLIRPLRDVFAAVFFVSVGMLADFEIVRSHPGVIAALVGTVIIGKFAVIFFGGLMTGLDVKNSSRVGVAMGQVGEFSFIIAGLGITSGAMSRELSPIIIAIAVVTAFTTPYAMGLADKIAQGVDHWMPRRACRFIQRYQDRLHVLSDGQLFPAWLKPGLGKLLLNAILVAVIFGVVRRSLFPFITRYIESGLLAQATGFFTALTISAPFVYAMLVTAGTPQGETRPAHATARSFFFLLFTLIWVGGLSTQFVSATASATITLLLALFLSIAFARSLERSYNWIETRFLGGFLPGTASVNMTRDAMRELAPWDAHLVRLKVHPNSSVAGKPLIETHLKRDHGLTVISIRRGDHLIAMPTAEDPIYPSDDLLVLGTDDQIENARVVVEEASQQRETRPDFADYEMRPFEIPAESRLVGTTVHSSRLREEFGLLIVGIERTGKRFLNPSPHQLLMARDTIWVVGPREGLRQLTQSSKQDMNEARPAPLTP